MLEIRFIRSGSFSGFFISSIKLFMETISFCAVFTSANTTSFLPWLRLSSYVNCAAFSSLSALSSFCFADFLALLSTAFLNSNSAFFLSASFSFHAEKLFTCAFILSATIFATMRPSVSFIFSAVFFAASASVRASAATFVAFSIAVWFFLFAINVLKFFSAAAAIVSAFSDSSLENAIITSILSFMFFFVCSLEPNAGSGTSNAGSGTFFITEPGTFCGRLRLITSA